MGRLGTDRAILMESQDHGVKFPADMTSIETIPNYQLELDTVALEGPQVARRDEPVLRQVGEAEPGDGRVGTVGGPRRTG